MTNEIIESINIAKKLLQTVRHAAMATVNVDGSPHNTPFFFMYDPRLTKIYWVSHPESLHSKNIMRTGQIFVAVYDAHARGGLYISAHKGHALGGSELDEALKIHNTFRAREEKQPLEKSYYVGKNPQRMWSAEITNIWILMGERDSNGLLTKEYRQEVTAKDLLG